MLYKHQVYHHNHPICFYKHKQPPVHGEELHRSSIRTCNSRYNIVILIKAHHDKILVNRDPIETAHVKGDIIYRVKLCLMSLR
jgi:hypothetical protein